MTWDKTPEEWLRAAYLEALSDAAQRLKAATDLLEMQDPQLRLGGPGVASFGPSFEQAVEAYALVLAALKAVP
jgi:methionine synthase II (cobalamin-independent)